MIMKNKDDDVISELRTRLHEANAKVRALRWGIKQLRDNGFSGFIGADIEKPVNITKKAPR